MRQWIPLASAAFYWAAVALRALHVRSRIGRSPNIRPRTSKERLLWAGWTFVVAGWACAGFFPSPPSFEGPVSLAAGLAAIVLGLAGTVWAHASMGDAWRVGVNPAEKTALVIKGPYRWMRHPIYAFQCLILLGVFLLKPSPLSLVLLFVHRAVVSVKVRDEETHLEGLHGSIYKEYRARTGSLWPKV